LSTEFVTRSFLSTKRCYKALLA